MNTYPQVAVWSVVDDDPTLRPRVYPTLYEAMADAEATAHAGLNPRVTRHGITKHDRSATDVSVKVRA